MGSLSIALMTIALIFVPTALMGATLPILVAHAAPRSGNTGHTVGTLYSVNTLGSAVAAAGTVLLLASLGQQRTTWVAAGVNVTVSALGYGLSRRSAT
jgi:predicted membrane-bound spermidine synthase